jgi:hypothetical protein
MTLDGLPFEFVFLLILYSNNSFKRKSAGTWVHCVRQNVSLQSQENLNIHGLGFCAKLFYKILDFLRCINSVLKILDKILLSSNFSEYHSINSRHSEIFSEYSVDILSII